VSPAPADGVLVRAARPEDAGPLALCHLACWREAYTGMVDPDRPATAVAAVDRRTAGWRQILAGNHGTLVAEDDGELVGFAAAGPGRDEDLDLTTELYALYGRRAYWGQGLGHRLVTAVLGEADSFLWVFRDNARARDFYVRHGYRPDGAEKLEEHLGGVEIRMVRRAWSPPSR
jgi:GNAT superfamily N-acetyltransferase